MMVPVGQLGTSKRVTDTMGQALVFYVSGAQFAVGDSNSQYGPSAGKKFSFAVSF